MLETAGRARAAVGWVAEVTGVDRVLQRVSQEVVQVARLVVFLVETTQHLVLVIQMFEGALKL